MTADAFVIEVDGTLNETSAQTLYDARAEAELLMTPSSKNVCVFIYRPDNSIVTHYLDIEAGHWTLGSVYTVDDFIGLA